VEKAKEMESFRIMTKWSFQIAGPELEIGILTSILGKMVTGWYSELVWGIAAIVGVVVAVAAFVMGWVLIHRRKARLRALAAQAGNWNDPSSPQDSFRYGMGMARRKSVRLSGNQIPVSVASEKNPDAPWDGWVLDRSQGGLRLRIPQAIQVGAILRVRTIQASDSMPWVELQVKNARAKAESWEVGCQFLKDPPPDVLRSFGSM
jgi:hypothetical protein